MKYTRDELMEMLPEDWSIHSIDEQLQYHMAMIQAWQTAKESLMNIYHAQLGEQLHMIKTNPAKALINNVITNTANMLDYCVKCDKKKKR